jgi:hypothetical protein
MALSVFYNCLVLLVLLLCSVHSGSATTAAQEENKSSKSSRSWTLFHRILSTNIHSSSAIQTTSSSFTWNVRGKINLTVDTTADETVLLNITHDEESLTDSLVNDIRTLDAIPNSTTWYQLKLIQNNKDDTIPSNAPNDDGILTSVPACHVLRSNFRDEIVLQFQARTANVISITYMPYISRFAPSSCADYYPPIAVPANATKTADNDTTTSSSTPPKLQFKTKISWETSVPGMVVGLPPLKDPITQLPLASTMKVKPPPGYIWFPNAISKRPSSASNGEPGGSSSDDNGDDTTKPDSSPFAFFKRYWYIFVPLMLMNIMNGLSPPPPPSQSGGDDTAGATSTGTMAATAVGAAAVGATNSGGGQARQRRGKKD